MKLWKVTLESEEMRVEATQRGHALVLRIEPCGPVRSPYHALRELVFEMLAVLDQAESAAELETGKPEPEPEPEPELN